MVIGFRVGNFRSFSTEESLSFRASSDDSHEVTHCVRTHIGAIPRLTRTAAIFGANGSGKSNLLLALRTMRELVLRSTSFSKSEFAQLYSPFYSQASCGSPTTFMIDLLLGGTRYRYGFSYDAERIVSEQLWAYESHKAQRWFGRQFDPAADMESWMPFSAKFSGLREMWRKATRPQSLFLTTAGQLNAEQLQPLMHWFEHQLDIALSSDIADLGKFAMRMRENSFKANVLAILRAVDLPVADVRVAEPNAPPQIQDARAATFAAAARPTIEFMYARNGMPPSWVDAKRDSSGAQRLVTLLVPLLDGVEKDRFVAIDEFDLHLHPVVARFLVQVINDPTATHRRVQVLLVTHNTTLMDLEILRRDELWLMEMDKSYSSRLTALIAQSPRRHELVAKTYIRGRYGGIPKVNFDQYHRASAARMKSSLPDPVKKS
jgi:AAA15 family ATPase/GTPase